MPEPPSGRGQCDGGEEISGELVVARRDAAKVLEFVEEALDEVALAVDRAIDDGSNAHVALTGDMGVGATRLDQLDDAARKEASIGDDVPRQGQAVHQGWKRRLVRRLASGEHQSDGEAIGIDDGVDLCRQSSTRTTDGVIRTPFFPPAAC